MPVQMPQQQNIPAPQPQFAQPQGVPQAQGQAGPDIGQLLMMLKMRQQQGQQGQPQPLQQAPQPIQQAAGLPPAPAYNPMQSPVPQAQRQQSIGDILFGQGRGG